MKDTSTRIRSILDHAASIGFNFRKKSVSAAGKPRRLVRLIFVGCFAQMLLFVLYLPNAKTSVSDKEPKIYKIETKKTATFYTGKDGEITIFLCNENGEPVRATRNIQTTITATTLSSLEEAKQMLASQAPVQQSSPPIKIQKNRLVILRGQQVAQLTMTHTINENDKDVHIFSFQPGRFHIFVEAENITTGETTVVVLSSARKLRAYAPKEKANEEEGRLLPVRLESGNSSSLKLVLSPPSKVTIIGGEQVASIRIELQYDNSDVYAPAPEDIRVFLEVIEEGNARIEPNILVINKNEANTTKEAILKSATIGINKVRVRALQVNGFTIKPDKKSYTFDHGPCSQSLTIRPQRRSAIANGLDWIELRIEALQQDGRVILPEEEGLEERQIFLELEGDADGVKFENEKGEVHIPKGKHVGTIKMFSTRSVSDLKVIAKSRNGLRQTIESEATPLLIRFSFPGWQLLFAAIGGAAFPLLQKQKYLKVLQGLVAGVVLFALSFFGALVSNPQSIGGVSAVLTKIPTENLFASLILGFLGGLLLMSIFKLRQPRSA